MYIKQINGDKKNNINDESQRVNVENEAVEAINGMLDEKYISDFQINNLKIKEEQGKYKVKGDYSENINYKLKINSMLYKSLNREITLILIYAELNNKEFNLLIKLDGTDYTYSIFGQDYIEKYNYSKDMQVQDIMINDDYIKINKYNQYTYVMNEF